MPRFTVEEKVAFIYNWRQRQPNISQVRFCEEQHLTPSTFNKWLTNEQRLHKTHGSKLNMQRKEKYPVDCRALREYIGQRHEAGKYTSVVDLLEYAKSSNLIGHAANYIARYMFCRRMLLSCTLGTYNLPRLSVSEESTSSSSADNTSFYQRIQPQFELIKATIVVEPPGESHAYGSCGCDTLCDNKCINASCFVECEPANCSAGNTCTNRWLGKTLEHRLEVFKTAHTGYGVRATAPIPTDTVVAEYCGELISKRTYDLRIEDEQPNSTYYMECTTKHGIDARHKGNIARFVNHACQPNLQTVKRVVGNTTRVFFITTQAIQTGEELGVYYNKDRNFTCLCRTCVGSSDR